MKVAFHVTTNTAAVSTSLAIMARHGGVLRNYGPMLFL